MTTWLRDDSDLTSSTGINSIDIGSVRISNTNIGTTGDTDILSFTANTLTVNASSGLRLVDSDLKCIKSATGATTIQLDTSTGNLTLSGAVSAQITAATQNSITSIPNLVTVGTIGTGTWQGTAVADSYIASASTWNAKVTCTKANILSALNGDLGGSTPIGDSNDTISVGNLTASGTITGDLTGDVTGDVTGNLTGNVNGVCTSTTKSSTILVTDNENTAEQNLITFVANASTSTGYKSLEMDGDLNYDPNTGTLYSPNISISGGISANVTGNLTGNVAGNLTGTILTAAQGNITSVGTLSALAVTGDITLGDDLIITGAVKDDDGVICVSFDSSGNIALAPSGKAVAAKIEINSMTQVASDVNKFLMLDGDEIKYADGGQMGTFLASHTNVTETVQDIVGAMFTSNTETRISATYEDGDGTIDLVVDDMTTDTTYSAGSLLDLSGTTFNVDLTELTDGTADVVGSADELVYLDDGTQKRKQIDEIKLSAFNNDLSPYSTPIGFTQNEPTFDATDTIITFSTTGNKQKLTLTNNCTDIHFKFPATSGNFICVLLQDATGGRTITNWKTKDSAGNAGAGNSGLVLWASGTAPSNTETANKADIASFYWDADNEIAYGTYTYNF